MKYTLNCSLLGFSAFLSPAFSQTSTNPKLDSLIHKRVFHYDTKGFSGAGWDSLKAEISKAQIVLIGEQHGEAEIPIFTMKVAEIFKPKALVVEIDPYTAAQLTKTSLDTASYSRYFKQHPYDFAFFTAIKQKCSWPGK
jgi:hypothetical protein